MTITIERPVWATSHEGTEDGEPGWFERQLTEATVEGCVEFGDRVESAVSRLQFEVCQRVGDQVLTIELCDTPSCGMTFRDAKALRDFASALTDAADEFDRVMGGAQ